MEKILNLLKERYFLKDEKSWEDIAKRVSKFLPIIYNHINNMEFIPSSPTLMNANTNGERYGTLSSCFTMGIEDSIEGIFDSAKECAIVTKLGGGVGINFTPLRGSTEVIKSLNCKSSGPVPFMEVFNSTLDCIRQGGRRRGAGMAQLCINHPNILDFIRAKKDINKLNRFNISVRIPDNFYRKLADSPSDIVRVKNETENKSFELIDPEDGKPVSYKKLWNEIIEQAWTTGEPGIFNETIAHDRCTLKHIDPVVLSNPCAEFTNPKYFQCSLGSINITKFIKDGKIDYVSLKNIVRLATDYIDITIDKNIYPLEKIKSNSLKGRPIGLGIMGLAHVCYMLGIPYNSDEALELAKDIMSYITLASMERSVENAKTKGKYEFFDYEVFEKANKRFLKHKQVQDINVEKLFTDIKKHGIRNSSQTSVAPTGTLSFISNVSSGIEPVFGLVFDRKIEVGHKEYRTEYMVDPVFENYIETKHKENKTKIYEYVSENSGSCQGCELLTKEEQKIFVTASDLTPSEHLDMLEVINNNTSLSVSKTINLSSGATKEEISKVYIDAHKRGIIGVTVYRDGCREGILLHNNKKQEENNDGVVIRKDAPERPIDLQCDIHELISEGNRFVVLMGKLNGTLYECFVTKDAKEKLDFNEHKEGIIRKIKSDRYDLIIANGEEKTLIENIGNVFDHSYAMMGRLTSQLLQNGVKLQTIVTTLGKDKRFNAFERIVCRVLKKYIKDGELVNTKEKCPECGADQIYYDGCITCKAKCGWSKCS